MKINSQLFVTLTCFALFFTLHVGAIQLSPCSVSPAAAWSWYKSMLIHYPLLTKSATSSTIMTLSDVICQELTIASQAPQNREKSSLDLNRVVHVAITGFVWSGPISHTWYSMLEKIVTLKDPLFGLIARIIVDALVFSPVAVSGYFACRSILEGSGVQGIREKLKTRFKPAVLGAWRFWPVANVINFGFVPVPFRVLYSNVMSLFWTGYLTHMNSKNMAKATQKKMD